MAAQTGSAYISGTMIDSVEIRHGRKPQNWGWNFDAICYSFRYISTSDLDGHIAISGCWSLP